VTAPPPVAGARSLAVALASSCARHAGRAAIRCPGREITYAQLAAAVQVTAAALARPLSRLGDGPPLAAVALPNDPDAIVAAVAAVAAGGAFLPLDATMPAAYLAEVLAQARPRVLVTTPALGETLRDLAPAVLTLADLKAAPAATAPLPVPGRGSPAYAVFTSGSTGRPKGVLLSHAALLSSTAARLSAYGVPERIPLVHSPAFDVWAGVVFWALLTGGTLLPGPPLADVAATVALCRDEQATHLAYPASLYPAFLDRAAASGPPAALECAMVGSEAWSGAVADRHAAVLPGADLYNEYGPSEACVWTSSGHVYDRQSGQRAPMTIGFPAPGTGYQLLGPGGAHVADGETGELYITGPQLAIGYLGQPELTAERFITLPGGRAYRTGDLARLTPGGYVFAGRADRQVKIAGTRIELAHVEAALTGHPGVLQAHVAVRPSAGGQVLAAWLVPRDGAGLAAADVRGWLAGRLPAAMVPAAWAVIAAMPVTTSGKVDAAALPEPALPAASAPAAGITPADQLEEELAAAIGGILGVPVADTGMPLGDLGASSLALVTIGAMIAGRYGAEAGFTALREAGSVAGIAALVRAAGPAAQERVMPRPAGQDVVPLSAQQQQVWFLSSLAPDASAAYLASCTLRLKGPLDPRALALALTCLVARHEILRTTFRDAPGGPVQEVRPPWQVTLPARDLTGPPAGRPAALRAAIARVVRDPIGPGALPLVRWELYRLGEDDWALVQVEHHLIHDGISANLLLGELRDAYAAIAAGREPDLPPLPAQYGDYALAQRAWRGTCGHAAQRDWWAAQLDGVPAAGTTFEPDNARPARQSFAGGRVLAVVPAALDARVTAACREHGVSRFAAYLAAFGLLAWRHTSAEDLVIGSAFSGRRRPGTERMAGMLVTALPLRLQITGAMTAGQAAARAAAVATAAQDHQEVPLTEIITLVPGAARDLSDSPLYRLMFAFHDSERPAFDAAGVQGSLTIEHNGSAKNNVNVICVPRPSGQGTDILWEYDRHLYTRATASQLAAQFLHVLGVVVSHWDEPVEDLDLFGPAEGARLAAAAGQPAQAPAVTWHDGPGAAIDRHPGAVAVICDGQAVTYQDLDEMTSAIEWQLAATGAGAGAVVAIACGPRAEHAAACLAVLRAGVAFTVLDPADPPSRSAAILRDAAPAAIIVTAATAPAFSDPGIPLIQAGSAGPAAQQAAPRRPAVRPQDAAYLTYTSGTSGEPKAVIASHAAAVTAARARTARYGTSRPAVLVTLPLNFDVATHMLMWALERGGTAVLPGASDPRDPAAIRRLIDAGDVTHASFTSSWYAAFLAAVPPGWQPPRLQAVAVGGEHCPPGLPARHAAALPGTALHNEYGPTEATAWCAAAELYAPGGRPAARITVGGPAAGYQLHVLDSQLRPVPSGARGELCIVGPGLATGYHHQPQLTAERFTVPAGGPLAGTRLYRTGDTARLRRDGTGLEILGRLDEQVKVRGYRIEPGEVQAALASHPAVTNAHVAARSGTLAAWAAVRPPGPGPAELRQWLAGRLPGYMVPAAITTLDALPLTPAGKVDRDQLPAPASPGQAPAEPHRGRLTGAGARLLEVLRRVTRQPGLGVDDDFFAAGGDSLLAIEASVAAASDGLDAPVALIYSARTARAIAAQADHAASSGAPARPEGTQLPLTGIQGWFLAQHLADPGHFNQARVYEVSDGVTSRSLRAALAAVIRRHDAFRTSFGRDPGPGYGAWHAVLGPVPAAVRLPAHDLPPGLPEDAVAEAAAAMHHGLDITSGPLWRAALYRDPRSGRRWLVIVMHHLITDAISWDVLAAGIESALAVPGRPAGHAPAVPATPPPLADGEHAWWEQLAAAPKPRPRMVPARTVPAATAGQLARASGALSPAATRQLLRAGAPRHADATAQSMVLAALTRALAPLMDGPGLYLMTEGHGRDAVPGGGAIIGWLTAQYPVLLADDQPHLAALAGSIARQLAAVPGHGTGYTWHRHTAAGPLAGLLRQLEIPPVTFNFLARPARPGTALRPSAIPAGDPVGPSNVLPGPLHVTTAIDGGRLHARFSADPEIIPPAETEAACTRLLALLEAAGQAVPLTDAPADPGAPPLLLIHPAGGGIDWYAPLARLLAPGQACYGIPGDTPAAPATLAGLAATALERARTAFPDGPWNLSGWSLGGAIAWEMARLLEREGEHVTVTLIDPPEPGRPDPDGSVLAAHLAALAPGLTPGQSAAAAAATEGLPPGQRAGAIAGHLAITGPDALERLATLLAHHRALATWRPAGQLTGPMRIIRPATGSVPGAAGWAALARPAPQVTTVPGAHATMLDGQGARAIAALLSGSPLPAGQGTR
jgi:amino acid adenylation domain-containing protein